MPTYAYACTTCGHRFEVQQSFSDPSLSECPECAGRLRKLFNTVGIVFKGSGFYRTDSRTNGAKGEQAASSGEGSAASSDGGTTGSGTKTTGPSEGSSGTGGSAGASSGSSSGSSGSSSSSSASSGSSSGSSTGSTAKAGSAA